MLSIALTGERACTVSPFMVKESIGAQPGRKHANPARKVN